jgi:hypothetical protein
MEKLVITFAVALSILFTVLLPIKTASAGGYGVHLGYGNHGGHTVLAMDIITTIILTAGIIPTATTIIHITMATLLPAIMQIIRLIATPIRQDPVIKSLNILMMSTATLTR